MASTELDDLLDRAEALNLHAAVDALTDAEARKLQAQNAATESEALAALAHLRWHVWRAEHPSELPLDNDAMACLARGLDGAELLAFSLSCKQFNAARKAVPYPTLRTPARSTLRSPSLRAWAVSMGCPGGIGFPCWAEAHSLKSADLNGRVCSILGPPEGDDSRCPVEFDTGRGGVEAVSIGPQEVTLSDEDWPPWQVLDLKKLARKKVRLSNLRILDDFEMVRAVRIMCMGELQESLRYEDAKRPGYVPAFRKRKLYVTQGTSLEWERDRCGLLPILLPKRHSAVVFMRACQAAGEKNEAPATFGDYPELELRKPFKQLYIGHAFGWRCKSELAAQGWRRDRMMNDEIEDARMDGECDAECQTDGNVETFLSPLMSLCGRDVFIQPVGVRRRRAVQRESAPSALHQQEVSQYGSNGCVAHLMTAPGNDPLDHPRWLRGGGSVVAFMTQQDLTPRDVELMWRLSEKNDPSSMSAEDYVAKFTAAAYDKHVRICNATDETMRRVKVTDDGVGYYDGERLDRTLVRTNT